MLTQSLMGLSIKPQGIYIDLTYGGGGHSAAILKALSTGGRLLAFDQDQASLAQAKTVKDPRLTFIQGNFRFLEPFLAAHHIQAVDGIIADLGTSSYQLNTPQRGFAARLEGPLDMRMNQEAPLTAEHILNTYRVEELAQLLKQYGEIKNSYQLARAIAVARERQPLTTISELKEAIQSCLPKRGDYKYYAQFFQALRIAVNDELGALKEMLTQTARVLKPQGRLVVLAYHSLEDRLVKRFIKTGNFSGTINQDLYGNMLRPFVPVHSKPLMSSTEEIAQNNRSRSARLRIAIRELYS